MLSPIALEAFLNQFLANHRDFCLNSAPIAPSEPDLGINQMLRRTTPVPTRLTIWERLYGFEAQVFDYVAKYEIWQVASANWLEAEKVFFNDFKLRLIKVNGFEGSDLASRVFDFCFNTQANYDYSNRTEYGYLLALANDFIFTLGGLQTDAEVING